MTRLFRLTALLTLLIGAGSGPGARAAAPITLTILHTNDVHSHFRSEKTPLKEGGLARLSTAIQAARAAHPSDSILVDGGDWSEGQIYYVEGAGSESLKLMDLLGYDAAVVGNHDWLNGPGQLLDAIQSSHPRMTLLGANFDTDAYARAAEFNTAIYSYTIMHLNGLKVALVGLANFDPVYAPYLSPVKTLDPGPVAARLASDLKKRGDADLVIGISHNSIGANQAILRAAPDLDLIIGAHDHQRLIHPVVVQRPGHPDAWIFEAGSWARYLGEVDLSFTPADGGAPASLALVGSHLTQIDVTIAEDPIVLGKVEELETRIAAKLGPLFPDHVADSDDELPMSGLEAPMGDLTTDAYRKATGADVAIEQNRLVYDGLHAGELDSSDFFNAIPLIYNPATGKTWTLHTWHMSGETLSTLLRLIYTWRKISDLGGLSLSGASVTFDPSALKDSLSFGDIFTGLFNGGGESPVHELLIDGKPISRFHTYTVAGSTGIVQALQTLSKQYYGVISLNDLTDTGIEDWRAVRDYARLLTPLDADKVGVGGRIRTWQPDLGIVPGSFTWDPTSMDADGAVTAHVSVAITNYGGQASPATGVTIDLSINKRGADDAVDADWVINGASKVVPSLAPGATQVFDWVDVRVPQDRGCFPLLVYVHTQGETNTSNDSLTRYFTQ